jgi:hypothetical protein
MAITIGNTTNFQDSSGGVKNLATELGKVGVGGGSGATALSGLTDVDTTTTAPTSGQVLGYNGTKWVPSTNTYTSLSVVSSDPVSPSVGQMWFRSDL